MEANYSPYVLLLLDSILLFAVCYQVMRRCRLTSKYVEMMTNSEPDNAINRKDRYRAVCPAIEVERHLL